MVASATPRNLTTLIERACAAGPVRVAVADAAQGVVLETLYEAQRLGLAEPHLIGPAEDIAPLLSDMGWTDAPAIIDAGPDADSAVKAVEMVHAGKADVVMKGNLHTDTFMHALLDADSGLRLPVRRVSHLFLLSIRDHDRLIGITDAAINIAPDLMAKAQIVQNAVEVFQSIGIDTPLVAVLSAVETVTGNIASALDAAALTLMARRGQITGAVVDGPLALDNAISGHAAAEKGIVSEVAGRADILLVPDLVTGNVLAKALEYLGGADAAGVALGMKAPVVLTSRADTKSARLASIGLAALMTGKPRQSTQGDLTEERRQSLAAVPREEADCCPLPAHPVKAT